MTTARVVWGNGVGETPLAAFDDALSEAGIHNYNLVTLSSMLPPNTTVAVEGTLTTSWQNGSLLPTVVAETRSDVTGQELVAGIGWQQAEEGGVLVEHTANSTTGCQQKITASLDEARDHRPNWTAWDDPSVQMAETKVGERPSSALVAVALANCPWSR